MNLLLDLQEVFRQNEYQAITTALLAPSTSSSHANAIDSGDNGAERELTGKRRRLYSDWILFTAYDCATLYICDTDKGRESKAK